MDLLIGKSAPMQFLYQQIRRAAQNDIHVLLIGETGTGKDLTAQAIHKLSERRDEPYIPVNLGSLPPQLVASELFGHEKGAFTGAADQFEGKFERAGNGTVFLDEIDSVEEKVQVSLLRLLEQKRFQRLGGKKFIFSNVRLIASSNAELEELVAKGRFRKDLFYRLDVFRIELPTLKERHGDIPLLISVFLDQFNKAFNKDIKSISHECLQILEAHSWPGNVRELKNVVQRAVIMCEDDELLPEHLPPRFQKAKQKKRIYFDIGTPLEVVERKMILGALEMTNNNRKKAAELLGISRRAIYNKLRKHRIE
jgi:DNA-binding NtrC family response regulator